MTHEPFVSADVAAEFLGINRRFLLSMARNHVPGAYPIGTGKKRLRNRWVFKLSELSSGIDPNANTGPPKRPPNPVPRYDQGIRRSSLK